MGVSRFDSGGPRYERVSGPMAFWGIGAPPFTLFFSEGANVMVVERVHLREA